MAHFEDFQPIFCPTADFLPQGGGRILVKYSPVEQWYNLTLIGHSLRYYRI